MSGPLRRLHAPGVEDIVEAGLCLGCGLCSAVVGEPRLAMERRPDGIERPAPRVQLSEQEQRTVRAVCPGLRISKGDPDATHGQRDPTWGVLRRAARVHAGAPDVRRAGSSGGALTAIAAMLIEDGTVDAVVHLRADPADPLGVVGSVSEDRDAVVAGAGSRYVPGSALGCLPELLDGDRRLAVVGKPCDIAAIHNLSAIDARVGRLVRCTLSFFCGGAPQRAFIETRLGELGCDPTDVVEARFRGDGCPGPTVFRLRDGSEVRSTYSGFWGTDESSWGLPFRCKICPDAIGLRADLVAFDTWPGGAPMGEGPGWDGLIARTEVGLDVLARAESSGALIVAEPISSQDIEDFQPHHRARRQAAAARVAAAGARTLVPMRVPARDLLRASVAAKAAGELLGAWRRAGRAREARPAQPGG